MIKRRISLPVLAFMLPTLALPVVLWSSSFWALRPPIAEPVDTVPQDAPQATRTPQKTIYQPLVAPIIVSLPQSQDRLKIEIGVALSAVGGNALLSRLKDRTEAVQAGLAETVMRIAEELAAEGRAESLRDALPDALRDALNQRLGQLGEEPAVIEVFITSWAKAG